MSGNKMVRGRSMEVGVWQPSCVATIAPANAELFLISYNKTN